MKFTTQTVLMIIIGANIALSLFIASWLFKEMKRIDVVTGGIGEIAQVLGQSAIISKDDSGQIIVHRVVTVADVQAAQTPQ